MKIFRRLSSRVKTISKNSVLTIGIFDGCHLGHQKILQKLIRRSRQLGVPAGLMTFHPHPERILNHREIKLIQTMQQKLEYMKQAGLDYCLILPMNKKLAGLSGEEFVRKYLKEKLGVGEVVVGENFRFGHNQSCGIKELRRSGRQHGIKVTAVKSVIWHRQPVSSSLIRRLLEKGQIGQAARLLGRPYEIAGQVVRGKGFGRRLGFPTINLKTANEILPSGVYAGLATVGNRVYPAAINIGFRPTFGGKGPSVEAHLLHFQGSLYGRKVILKLYHRLRDEKKFSDTEALKNQIAADVEEVRKYFFRPDARRRQLDFFPVLSKYSFFKKYPVR